MDDKDKKIIRLIKDIERKKRELFELLLKNGNPMHIFRVYTIGMIASKTDAILEDCIEYKDVSNLVMAIRGSRRPTSLMFGGDGDLMFRINNIAQEDMAKILEIVAEPIFAKIKAKP